MSTVILDDHDPRIVYSSGWTAGGVSAEYNSTTMYTDIAGVTAKLTFHGISIGVYGTLGSNSSNQTAPQTQYNLDSNKPVVFQPTLTSSTLRNQRFYQSPEISNDEHTLVVTNLLNGSSLFILDYFLIASGDTTASTASSSSASPTGLVGGTSGAASNRTNIPVIVGSVLGALTFIFLVFGIIYFCRRRKSRPLKEDLNPQMVQSAWVDSSRLSNDWRPLPVPPLSGPNNITMSSSSRSTTPLPLPSKMTLTSASPPPSTSNRAASSTDNSDLPAPPEYKP